MLDRQAEPPRPVFHVDVTFDGEQKLTAPKELIKRVLPADAGLLVFLAGQSGAAKTFMALRMAICLASGKAFLGLPVRETVGVIYVAGEGAGAIDRRVIAAKLHLDIDTDLALAVVKAVPNLSDDKLREIFIKELKRIAEYMVSSGQCLRVGLVTLDTVSTCFAMKDENNNAEITTVCRNIREIGHELNAVMLAAHHYGKSADAGLRGGSNWHGHADLVLSLLAERDNTTGEVSNRRVALGKQREGEEGPLTGFELRFISLGENEYGDEFGSCAIEPCDAAPEKPKKPAKQPRSQADRTFDEAFDEIVWKGTTQRQVNRTGPTVQAVHLGEVETEFKRRYAADGDTKEKQQATKKKQWQNARKNALGGRGYAAETDANEIQWLWKARQGERE